MDDANYTSDRQAAIKDKPPRIPEREMYFLLRFAKLVKVMLAVQRRYFDGERSQATLNECKELEARVKKAIDWVFTHASGNPVQKVLFDDGKEENHAK